MPRKADEDNFGKYQGSVQKEKVFHLIDSFLSAISSSYGFEEISLPFVDDRTFYESVFKSGFLSESEPLQGVIKNNGEFLLRPFAPLFLLRAYETQKMNSLPHPLKFYFAGNSFFQSSGGHIKERDEVGLMMIGEEGPAAKAEIIHIIWKATASMGFDLSRASLAVNAIGCKECYSSFKSSFTSYFRKHQTRLCKNCKKDLRKASPKILRCQEEKCQIVNLHAPKILDFLCDECKKHLRGLLEFMDEIQIPYILDHKMFKEGLWYNRIVFELNYLLEEKQNSPEIAAKKIILGEGGEVSQVAELINKKRIDAACGVLFRDVISKHFSPKQAKEKNPQVFLVQLGELAKKKSLGIAEELRHEHITFFEVLGKDSLKSQLRLAETMQTQFAIIIGQKEAIDGTTIIREMESGGQETVPQEKLIDYLKRKIKR